jgi:hypothetical protein
MSRVFILYLLFLQADYALPEINLIPSNAKDLAAAHGGVVADYQGQSRIREFGAQFLVGLPIQYPLPNGSPRSRVRLECIGSRRCQYTNSLLRYSN